MPSRDICQRGTSTRIQCQADRQLALMFWYQQLPGQSLTLIAIANQGSQATYESEFPKDKFPISRPNLTFSVLTVSNLSPEDSSIYFCSAGDTVLGRDRRPEQEPQLPPPPTPPPAVIQMSLKILSRQAGGETTALGRRQLLVCLWVSMSIDG